MTKSYKLATAVFLGKAKAINNRNQHCTAFCRGRSKGTTMYILCAAYMCMCVHR